MCTVLRVNQRGCVPVALAALSVCRYDSLNTTLLTRLAVIPESREPETDAEGEVEPEADDEEEFVTPSGDEDMEIRSLMTALDECWSFCTTLGKLSNQHRARLWRTSGTPDGHERAWKCCWKLCQQLYEYNREKAKACSNVKLNLDLCRDFCQALFDVRHRRDEAADSVLRVSFELNTQYVMVMGAYRQSLLTNSPVCTVLRTVATCRSNSGKGRWTFTSLCAIGL